MSWETARDAALKIAMGTFGKVVTYTPTVGSPTQISGVFDNSHVAVIVNGVEHSQVAPTLGIRLADLAAKPTKGDQVTVGGVTYKVIDSQEDGAGGTTLILQKV
jgi:hypothetical protein